MDLSLTLAAQPLWLSGGLIIGASIVVTLIGHFFVRKRVGLERLINNNEVAGFKFGVLGVLYAVLLAFMVIVVWEQFRDSQTDVEREAEALITLHLLAAGFRPPARESLEEAIRHYGTAVVNDEWQTMAHGNASPAAQAALRTLFSRFAAIDPAPGKETEFYHEALRLLADLSEARSVRLDSAEGTLPDVLWISLIAGAVTLVGFTFFFGAPNLWAQLSMTGLLCFQVALILFIMLHLNHPFTGDVRVLPTPFQRVLERMVQDR